MDAAYNTYCMSHVIWPRYFMRRRIYFREPDASEDKA